MHDKIHHEITFDENRSAVSQKRAPSEKTNLAGVGAVFIGTVLLYLVYSFVMHSKHASPRANLSSPTATAQEPVDESLSKAATAVSE